jgi:lambda family phage portal protein
MQPEDYKRRFGDGGRRARALAGGGRGAYDAGRFGSREMASWHPPRDWVNNEVLGDREKVQDRARDMARNHPVIAGAIDRRVESVVGPEIRIEAQPAFEAMGKDPEWADDWSTNTEVQFAVWGQNARFLCDVEQQSTFGGIVEGAYRHWWNDGDALAVVKMLPRGGAFQTAIELVDPDRLSNPNGMADNALLANGNRVIGGVEIARGNWPVAYHIRVAHPAESGRSDTDSFRWERVARFGPTGRPVCVHAFKRSRAGQRRGISRFVSAIKRMKMFDRYDDAEIEAALLNAVMAAWVESPFPTKDVTEAMAPASSSPTAWNYQDQLDYRMDNAVRVDGARVIHGLPGEKLTFQRAERPSANYPDFQATGLRSLAAAFGLSYAQVSANWSDINYSSARAMLNEIWRGLLHDRHEFVTKFCTPIYAAWLEEAVAIGRVKVPGGPLNFYKWRDELTMCDWMGPGRGSIDPLKEAQANDYELNAGTTNLSMIADSNGADHRKVLMGQARDKRLREKLGLGDYAPLKAGPGRPETDGAAHEAQVAGAEP